MMKGKKEKIEEGQRFGMRVVMKEVLGRSRRSFLCKCDCGKEHIVFITSLKSKKNKSCGCYSKHSKESHGRSHTSLYKIWLSMKKRCDNKMDKSYNYYGGRGITYDSKRKSFEGFYDDMGLTYNKGLSIDRIDNNGNYCKENCRWTTHLQQMRNTRLIKIYEGKCISEWVEILGIPYSTVQTKLNKGRTIEEIKYKHN